LAVLRPGIGAPLPEPNGAHEPIAAEDADDDIDSDEAALASDPAAGGEAVAVPLPGLDPDPDGDDSREQVAVGGAVPEAGRDD
jgi:hypothetical protein